MGSLMQSKGTRERIIEGFLRHFKTYQVGILNSKKQLEYIYPTLVTEFSSEGSQSVFYICNDTEGVALDRIESKRALDLTEEIERLTLIVSSIENAMEELKPKEREFICHRYFESLTIYEVKEIMGYADEKSIYRVRRNVLDKLLISLNNLLSLK